GLLGMFSLDSLEQVAKALAAGDSRRMLDVVAELEANGRSLQHFARELARYVRNLLVVKIAGGATRLVAAWPGEQQRLAETAALLEAKQTHVADALENSELAESESELSFTTPKMYVMYLKQAEFESAVRRVLGKPVKITIKAGETSRVPGVTPAAKPPRQQDEVTARALGHPEVRRFQEMFPDSQVRAVRN